MSQRRALIAVVSAALVGCLLTPASAFPGFARKYGFDCTMCHVQFPKLNDFGQRFRDNGYQVPGQEDMDRVEVEALTAIAMRTQVGYVSHSVTNVPDDADLKEFNIGGLDLLFGGLIKQDIGYFGIYTPRLDPAKGGDSQTGRLEMVSILFNNLGGGPIDLRVGRFEPGFLGFSAKRTFTFTGYECYDFTGATGGDLGGFALSDTQEGLEISAHLRNGWNGVAGWVNGSQNHGSDHTPRDFYGRVYKVFGAGEGQVAGQRVGLMGYHGKARPGSAERGPQYSFNRLGVDASVNVNSTNIMAQYIKGRDDRGFWRGAGDYSWKGGFVEINHGFRPELIGFGRYDWITTPAADGHDVKTWVLGARWNIERNLALHLEYADRKVDGAGQPDASTKDLYLRLDAAF